MPETSYKVQLRLSEEDIENSTPNDVNECIFARSITRQFPGLHGRVSTGGCGAMTTAEIGAIDDKDLERAKKLTKYLFRLSDDAVKVMRKFDLGDENEPQPMDYDLTYWPNKLFNPAPLPVEGAKDENETPKV